jgi:hypothetical protein
LPNDQLTTDVLKQCIAALSLQFTDERVSVDVTTCNAARIWKLYGTSAAKGDSTRERPHRFAKIIDAPADIVTVNPGLLTMLADMNPRQFEAGAAGKRDAAFSLPSWIEKHGLPVVRGGEWQGGRKWILNPCPWNKEHENESAYILQFPNGAVAAGCHHNSCSNEDWHSLKKLYGAGNVTVCDAGETTSREPGCKVSQAEQLMEFAEAGEFFHTSSGGAYVTIPVDGHYETWATGSKRLREWLSRQYYAETRSVPSSQALNEAISLCDAKARFDGEELQVFTRIADVNGKIYLDLADANWNVIEIDEAGWRVTSKPSVRFQRPRGLQQMPPPVSGGSIDDLRRLINVGSESDWKMLVAWLLATLRPYGPYPILVLHGEQGSAKSTTARMLRSLVDPNTADLRSEPRDVRDVMIAANNGWIVSLDNLSSLPVWISDALCRLSTGGGFSTRQLYTDSDETLIEVQRPCILNGIEELACRGDLLDRSLILYLPTISESARRAERDLWSEFEKLKPRILGALLTAVSGAMARYAEIKLHGLPRLADFALWATAAEHSLGWSDGAFLQAYTGNRTSANDLALEASPVTLAIRQVCAAGWLGTATELLNELNAVADDGTRRQKNWPSSSRSLSNILRRLTPNLRNVGILVEFRRESSAERRRIISISQKTASQEDLGSSVNTGSKKLREPGSLSAFDSLDKQSSSAEAVTGAYNKAQQATQGTTV